MVLDWSLWRRHPLDFGPVLLAAWLLASLFACHRAPDSSAGKSSSPPHAERPAQSKDILAGWHEPRAVFVFTGGIHGYLEPCGCSERQSGGFARRGDLLRQLREEKKWSTSALDVGGTLNDARISYPQSKIKFSVILKGLNELGYKGLALGKEELMLGGQELYTQHTQVSAEEGFNVPFLGGNITIFGSRELGTPQEIRIFEVGGLKVAVTAIAGNTTRRALADSGIIRDESELAVQDPRQVLPSLVERMQAQQPDLMILLSAAEMEESQALAKEFPAFDIVVTAESVEDPRPDPVYIGNTLLVQVGKKGKNAAVVGVFPEKKLKSTVIELDMDRFQELPAMHELMKDYQHRLKEAWPELSAQSIADPPGGPFVGAQACKECHTYAYSVWSKTKHAHGFDSIAQGRPGQEDRWISRVYDPECLCCHTTGWDPQRALRYQSGFVDMEHTPLLAGQQCENCHGAGGEHTRLEQGWKRGMAVTPEMQQARDAARLTLSRAKSDVCGRCHDLDNSPKFDFDKFWPKVNHTGRKD